MHLLVVLVLRPLVLLTDRYYCYDHYKKDYIIKLFRRKCKCARPRTELILPLKMNFNDRNKMALHKTPLKNNNWYFHYFLWVLRLFLSHFCSATVSAAISPLSDSALVVTVKSPPCLVLLPPLNFSWSSFC